MCSMNKARSGLVADALALIGWVGGKPELFLELFSSLSIQLLLRW